MAGGLPPFDPSTGRVLGLPQGSDPITLINPPSSTGSAGASPTGLSLDQLAALAGLRTGLQQQEGVATAEAAGARTAETGFASEAQVFQQAGAVASENERIALLAGRLSVFQQQREAARVQGQAIAAYTGGGAVGGSLRDIMRSNFQQAALGSQLINVQAALTAGGFEEQGVAAQAQLAGAQAQTEAAAKEAAAFTAQASEAARETKRLTDLFGEQPTPQVGPLNPTEQAGNLTPSAAAGFAPFIRAGIAGQSVFA